MAIFHLNARIVSRGKGQSAVAKAAYNAHDLLTNENTGDRHDYRYKGEVLFSGIFAPKYAPDWVQELTQDRQALWSAVEKFETRKNSQLAREIEIALPHELTDKQREYLVKDFVRENFVRHGMIADVAIHAPSREGDDRNHHAHILLTMREIGPDGFGAKMRELNSKDQLNDWREKWEHSANHSLERFGHEARIDRRTLEAQGIEREPGSHVGPTATDFEREGVKTERGGINREIEERNRQREKLKKEYKDMTAAEIRSALAASNDGLDFMMQLNERGLCVAQDSKGRYAAVSANGFIHSLDEKTFGKDAHHMRDAIEDVRRAGLIIPSVDDLREERKQRREELGKQRELERQRRTAQLAATLYDSADMVSQQRDAVRHLKDARRIEQRVSGVRPLHPDDHQRRQQEAQEQQRQKEERDRSEKPEAPRDPREQAREEKQDRTEQTDAQQRRAAKEALQGLFDRKPASTTRERGDKDKEDEYGRELER